MRKQTKLVAVLSATALLAIGASAAAFAAGWDNSTGEWQWLDNEGNPVYDQWKKSGNDWFYIGSDGVMLTDSLIDDDGNYYYVNETGAMVSNTWVSRENEDGIGEAEYNWYYFGADGKAYTNSSDSVTTSKIKTINGKKYTFDVDGKMLYGWVQAEDPTVQTDEEAWKTAEYYFGDWTDGAAANGWVKMNVTDADDTKEYWFWFDANGKAKKDGKKTIDGKTYYFAEDGHMLVDFVNASENTAADLVNNGTATTSDMVYVNGDGSLRKNTWIWAVPTEDYDETDYNDDDYSWFYVKSNGKFEADTVKTIGGRSYAFDEKGRMVTGLVTTTKDAKEDIATVGVSEVDAADFAAKHFANIKSESEDLYYFSSSEDDGSMKKGYQNVEFADNTYQMYFNTTNGKAENGYVSKIKKFVAGGIVLKANREENTLAAVEATYNDGYTLEESKVYYGADIDAAVKAGKELILVNTAGTIQSKGVKKDADDRYYVVDKHGRVKATYTYQVKAYSSDRSTDANFVKAFDLDCDENGKVDTWIVKAE